MRVALACSLVACAIAFSFDTESDAVDAAAGSSEADLPSLLARSASRGWWEAADAFSEACSSKGLGGPCKKALQDQMRKIQSGADRLVNQLNSGGAALAMTVPALEWAQTADTVMVRVKFAPRLAAPALVDQRLKYVNITHRHVLLESSSSTISYGLRLPLMAAIDPSRSKYDARSSGRVTITLTKRTGGVAWPQLLHSSMTGSKALHRGDPTSLVPHKVHTWWEQADKSEDAVDNLPEAAETPLDDDGSAGEKAEVEKRALKEAEEGAVREEREKAEADERAKRRRERHAGGEEFHPVYLKARDKMDALRVAIEDKKKANATALGEEADKELEGVEKRVNASLKNLEKKRKRALAAAAAEADKNVTKVTDAANKVKERVKAERDGRVTNLTDVLKPYYETLANCLQKVDYALNMSDSNSRAVLDKAVESGDIEHVCSYEIDGILTQIRDRAQSMGKELPPVGGDDTRAVDDSEL